MGIIDADTPLPSYPENLPDWNDLTPEQQDIEDLRMAVYAAMVEKMDNGIGRVLSALKAKNLAENTLIIFLSDNGTDSFSVMDAPLLKRGLLPGDKGSNYQPGTGWAYSSGAPRRLYKISQHGGGVKTGAIAWWPRKGLTSGAVLRDPLHVVDIMPTILDCATGGTEAADSAVAGKSFAGLLTDKEWTPTSPLYFQFMDNRAIRTSKWSLVEVDGNGWELYDNQKDPLETNDLSKDNPAQVAELERDWLNWWTTESGQSNYVPESTAESPHYKPQGDRGSGRMYTPSAMPASLKERY